MLLTDLQAHTSKKAQNENYTFLYWNKGMGKTLVAMHAMFQRSLDIRGNRGAYIHVDPYAYQHILSYGLIILDRVFHMNCQVGERSMKFGNGSSIKIVSVDQYLTEPYSYDFIVLDDSHYLELEDARWDELMNRIMYVDRGREDIKRVLETRLRKGEIANVQL